MALRVFKIVSDRGPVGNGVTGARYVYLPAVCKTNEKLHHCVANEYIAERIGRFIGLPIPPGSVGELTTEPPLLGYMSLNFTLTGEKLPPINPVECCSKLPDLSTGVVMFDILIANPDRHAENLAATLQELPYEMNIFDHSHALFGHNQSNSVQRLTDLQDRLAITGGSVTKQHRHCLIDELRDESFFPKWIERVESLPDHFIQTTCEDLLQREFIETSEFNAMVRFLRHRRDKFRKLIKDNLKEFTGLKQLGLTV